MTSNSYLSHASSRGTTASVESGGSGGTRKIAVLFTDIVESTRYFKIHGDLKGRRMLQRHQHLASRPVNTCNGRVVKTLGDGIMAYFEDPYQAVEAAVGIQLSFRRYNAACDPGEKIEVRIGIHFGEGLVEKDDIFGNVVNLAAKIVDIGEAGQIHVSHAMFHWLAGHKNLVFNKLNALATGTAWSGFGIYRLEWEKTSIAVPGLDTLLYLRLDHELSTPKFLPVWESLAAAGPRLWAHRAIRQVTDEGGAIALVFDNPATAVDIARSIEDYLHANSAPAGGFGFLPVRIVLDCGLYSGMEPERLVPQQIEWDAIEAGTIYLSHNVLMELRQGVITAPENSIDGPHYHRLDEVSAAETALFHYQNDLLEGVNARCFYCGDGRHTTTDCPSKNALPVPNALHRIGLMSLAQINRAFLAYLLCLRQEEPRLPLRGDNDSSEVALAMHAFWELNRVYQLPFLGMVWNNSKDSWNTLKHKKTAGGKGGNLWLAYDCIRVNKLAEAEELLQKYRRRYRQDFRWHALWGFIALERDHGHTAALHFEAAYELAGTDAQKVWLLLMLERLYSHGGKSKAAASALTRIGRHERHCPEAFYIAIRNRFTGGERRTALRLLRQLIKADSVYYLYALIDPELGPYNRHIHAELRNLQATARLKAQDALPRAENSAARLSHLLGPDSDAAQTALNQLEQITQLIDCGTYAGCQRAHESAVAVATRAFRIIADLKSGLHRQFGHGYELCRRALNTIAALPPYPALKQHLHRLGRLQESIYGLERDVRADQSVILKVARHRMARVSAELKSIEARIRWWVWIATGKQIVMAFLKKSLWLQIINVVFGLGLVPILVHGIAAVYPSFDPLRGQVDLLQKWITFGGGVTCLALALFLASRIDSSARAGL